MPTILKEKEGGIDQKNWLWKHVAPLKNSSALLLYLAKQAPGFTISQFAFFFMAATKDAAGQPATQSQIIEAYGEGMSTALRNTYRQLLEPSRAYPKAVGWLTREPDPNDDRSSYLRLTKKGREVIEAALIALGEIDV